jgi:tetratricopeptide (TPR) repeat protein
VLSVFVFFAGVIGGILFCSRYAHEPLTPKLDITADTNTAAQIERIEKEIAVNTSNAGSWTQLGNLYFDSGQYEKAIEAYQKSLSLEPNNADVWTDLGIMYRSTDRPHQAIEAFERAMTIDPKHQNSRFNKGVVLLYDLNEEEPAIKEWEELSRINPSYELTGGEHLDELILHYKLKEEDKKRPSRNQPGKEGVTNVESQRPL